MNWLYRASAVTAFVQGNVVCISTNARAPRSWSPYGTDCGLRLRPAESSTHAPHGADRVGRGGLGTVVTCSMVQHCAAQWRRLSRVCGPSGPTNKMGPVPGTGPILFLLASKTVFFFFAKKKKMGLAPRGQRDLPDLEGPQKPRPNRTTYRRPRTDVSAPLCFDCLFPRNRLCLS